MNADKLASKSQLQSIFVDQIDPALGYWAKHVMVTESNTLFVIKRLGQNKRFVCSSKIWAKNLEDALEKSLLNPLHSVISLRPFQLGMDIDDTQLACYLVQFKFFCMAHNVEVIELLNTELKCGLDLENQALIMKAEQEAFWEGIELISSPFGKQSRHLAEGLKYFGFHSSAAFVSHFRF